MSAESDIRYEPIHPGTPSGVQLVAVTADAPALPVIEL
jgi:hypothetical protein